MVNLVWSPVPGATSYVVLRDEAEVAAGIAGASYDDEGASAEPPSADGLNLHASDGTLSDIVRLAWGVPTVHEGSPHQYRVAAVGAGGQSRPSAADSGYRGASPITGYEVSINSGDWVDVGRVNALDDSSAPAGTIDSAGVAVASDDQYSCYLALELLDVDTSPGAPVSYRVRARNAVGVGDASEADAGYRSAPSVQIQWQRSLDVSGTEFEDVAGGNTLVFDDSAGPLDESVRVYRARVTAPGLSSPSYSVADEGSRRAVRLLGEDLGAEDWFVRFGESVAVDAGRIAVGAVGDDSNGRDAGRVYFFSLDGDADWVADGAVSPSDPVEYDAFGLTVALSATFAVVGDPARDAVYIYHREVGGWIEDEVVDGVSASGFGLSVDWSNSAGSVRVFCLPNTL